MYTQNDAAVDDAAVDGATVDDATVDGATVDDAAVDDAATDLFVPPPLLTRAQLPPSRPFTGGTTENDVTQCPAILESRQSIQGDITLSNNPLVVAPSAVVVESRRYGDNDCTDITYTPATGPGNQRGRAMLKPSTVPVTPHQHGVKRPVRSTAQPKPPGITIILREDKLYVHVHSKCV